MTDHCENHADTNKQLGDLSKQVANQNGRWWVMGLVLGLALAALFTMQRINDSYNKEVVSAIKSATEKTADSTIRIDKSVASYMSANSERLNQIVSRLDRVETELRELRRSR